MLKELVTAYSADAGELHGKIEDILFCSFGLLGQAQQAELHYDFRHTVDPRRQAQNFPTFYFEYFKSKDYGSTLFKFRAT